MKKIDENNCEVNLERLFTKAKTDREKCCISEYMDSISRNGANLLELTKNNKFNENMPNFD